MVKDRPTQTIDPLIFLNLEKQVVKNETTHKPIKQKWKPVAKPSIIVVIDIKAKNSLPHNKAYK